MVKFVLEAHLEDPDNEGFEKDLGGEYFYKMYDWSVLPSLGHMVDVVGTYCQVSSIYHDLEGEEKLIKVMVLVNDPEYNSFPEDPSWNKKVG